MSEPPLTVASEVTADELADATQTRTWDRDSGPVLWIHDGWWHYSPVIARYKWPDGRIAYRVVRHDTIGRRFKTTTPVYWWEPAAMRRAARGMQRTGINAGELPTLANRT